MSISEGEIIYRVTIENGLEVYGIYMPWFRSVAIGLSIRCGAVSDYPISSGSAHLLEHIFSNQIPLDSNWAQHGINFNAITGIDSTLYYSTGLSENALYMLDRLSFTLTHKDVKSTDVEREKRIILSEIARTQDRPTEKLSRMMYSNLFFNHPYSQSVLGTENSLTNADPARLKTMLEDYYVSNRSALLIAGKFEWEEIIAAVNKWKLTKIITPHFAIEKPQLLRGRKSIFDNVSIQQQHLILSLYAPGRNDPRVNTGTMFAAILGESDGEFVYQLKKAGVEKPSIKYDTLHHIGIIYLYMRLPQKMSLPVIDLFNDSIKKLNSHGLSKQKMSILKRKVLTRILLNRETPILRLFSLLGNWLEEQGPETFIETSNKINSVDSSMIIDIANGSTPILVVGLNPVN